MNDTITTKEKLYSLYLPQGRSLTITHSGTSEDSETINNFCIFIGDTESEKDMVSKLFMKFEIIQSIEVIRFQLQSTVYERTTK